MVHRTPRFALFAASGLTLATFSPAWAQTAGNQNSDKLDEVVVTAERRETDLQSTPISLVAFNEETLEARSVKTIQDLAQITPGLSIGGEAEAGSTRPVFMIRGIGQPGGRESQERGVGLYVDDVYIPRTTGSLLQLLDVERVEVLRGPQGTLFGRNTPGGAIRYISRKPTTQFGGEFSAAAGSYNRTDVTGLLNLPLGELFSARLQVGSFKRDGYVKGIVEDHRYGDVNDTVLRGVLRFQPSDDLTVDASYMRARSQDYGPAAVITALVPGTFEFNAMNAQLVKRGQTPLTANDPRFVLSDRYAVNGSCYIGLNTYGASNANGINIFNDQLNYCDYGETQQNTITSVDVNWNLNSAWSFRSLSAYISGESNSTVDWSHVGNARLKDVDHYTSFSQEFQLKFSGERLDTVGGLYYFRETPEVLNYSRNLTYAGSAPFSGDCCTGFNRTRDMQTDSYGVFAQLHFKFTDKLNGTLGARHSYDKKSLEVMRSDRPTAAPGRLLKAADNWDNTDYRATLQYDFTSEFMVYGTVATGYKAGGINDSPDTSTASNSGITTYDAEHVTSYELGMKSEWLDRRMRFNLTGFFMDYRDLQLGTPLIDTTVTPPTVVLAVQNAGKVELSGIEAELLLRPVRNFTINASLSTLHLNIVSLPDGNALLKNCSSSQQTFANCEHQDIARAPALQYTLGALYDFNLPADAKLGFSANYGYIGAQESSSSTSNSIRLDSYGLLNLRAQLTPASEKWSAALAVTNATNQYYYSSGGNLSGFYGSVWAAPGRPREIGVEVKAKF